MTNKSRRFAAVYGAMLAAGLILGNAPQAQATWKWKDPTTSQDCNPDGGSDVQTLPPPSVMMMLDQSGSMGPPSTGGEWLDATVCPCDYTATVRDWDSCNYTGGYYCSYSYWHYLSGNSARCTSCSTASECVSNADSIIDPYVRHFCGTSQVSANFVQQTTINDTMWVAGDATNASCQREVTGAFAGTYSDFDVTATVGTCQPGSATKWAIAQSSIDAVVADMTNSDPDEVEFGLGLFHGSGATIETEAAPNNGPTIDSILGSNGPGGGTPTETAIDTMKNSSTIQNAPGAAAGLLITDGYPSSSDWDGVVQAACEHRAVAPMYVVGFGGGTNVAFNDVLAAAGGTGTCDNGGDPCAAGPDQYSASHWQGKCTGSRQADDQQALIDALSAIVNQVSCTFPLSAFTGGSSTQPWDQSRQGCAADDYECLKILLKGYQRLHYVSYSGTLGPDDGIGWRFGDASHTTIKILNQSDDSRVTGDYCKNIQDGLVTNPNGNDVSIHLACMCQQPTTQSCGGSGHLNDFCYREPSTCTPPGACECGVGTWSCTQGMDSCDQATSCNPDQLIDADQVGDSCTVGQGVCAVTGSYYCASDGSVQCSATPNNGAATQEICDGKDDNCDGAVDNVGWTGSTTCHVAGNCVYVDGKLVASATINDGGVTSSMTSDSSCPQTDQTMADETNRCSVGYAACSSGGNVQCELLQPMPEVCNGLDDDCNGGVDNLGDSRHYLQSNGYGSYPSFPSEGNQFSAAACFKRDVCMCDNGHDAIAGADFTSYLNAWAKDPANPTPQCYCGAGLSQ